MANGGDEHIRSRAYELWEKDGRPEGKDKEHWSRAETETQGGDGQQTAGDGETVAMQAEVPVVRRTRTMKQSPDQQAGAPGTANVASSLPAGTSGQGDQMPAAGVTRRGKNG
jgi:hypothetical protein